MTFLKSKIEWYRWKPRFETNYREIVIFIRSSKTTVMEFSVLFFLRNIFNKIHQGVIIFFLFSTKMPVVITKLLLARYSM